MADLTSEQTRKIKENQKSPKKLPIVFISNKDGSSPISRLLESHLILQSDSNKRKALEWIDKIISLSKGDEDRAELMQEFITYRKADNDTRLDEINKIVGEFNKFRQSFIESPYNPSEIQQFFTDVSTVLGSLNSIISIEDHSQILINVMNNKEK